MVSGPAKVNFTISKLRIMANFQRETCAKMVLLFNISLKAKELFSNLIPRFEAFCRAATYQYRRIAIVG